MRLLRRLVDGDLPAAVDVPTGLGKTSVMALWLMALAAGADVPRRLVYVVDRRAIVDHATRFAERLRRNVPSTTLPRDLGLGERPLPISTPRGGAADNRDWLEDPSMPTIVVGTVDSVGSRLLFAGYGVSRPMRPCYAGFLGADTLFVLDEAHLCPAFEALLRDIADRRDSAFGPTGHAALRTAAAPPPPFRVMSLSPTGRELPGVGGRVFRLRDDDHDERPVRERLTARKRMALIPVSGNLADQLARRAIELADGPPARVLVCCDSRSLARAVKDRIERVIGAAAQAKKGTGRIACELLVGERRACEREALERWLEHHGFLDPAQSAPRALAVVVATSAGEVGVDLDADHLVCDLVAHERMVQRLGRVNRRGGAKRSARVDVLIPPTKERDAAVFAARTAALAQLPRGADGRHDASPLAMARLRSRQAHASLIERATTPAPLYPELTRPDVEAWALTSLMEHPGRPDVEPWLRGWGEREEPRVAVVWRRHLPRLRADGASSAPAKLVESFFQSAPIHASERLEAESSHVWPWLLARAERMRRPRSSDHDHAAPNDIIAVVLDRTGEFVAAATRYDLLAAAHNRTGAWRAPATGATLVVRSAVGGLAGGMLDEDSDGPVATADADEAWQGIRERPDSERPMVRFRVQRLAAQPDSEGLAGVDLAGWRHLRTFETDFDGDGGLCGGLAVFTWPGDGPDEDSRSLPADLRTLREHAEHVVSRVRAIAAGLNLAAADTDALIWAARLHDEGKAGRRWQDAMNAPEEGRPYATTRASGDRRLLAGVRHEFGSLLKAEQAPLPAESRDLILHLIAAHHGHARPLIATGGCEEAPPSVLEASARAAALRYARLQRRYGLWGLAWREAILRAADQSASRDRTLDG